VAYASIPDVSALSAKRVFGATSIPSASQVKAFLDFGAADLDSILSADGYSLPVPTTATIALLNLRRLNAISAWVQVEHSAQLSDDLDRAQEMWDAARTEFKTGGVSLYDLPRLGGENFARSQSAATPFFTRDMVLAREPRDQRPQGWQWRGR
jgi:hypothetical protein